MNVVFATENWAAGQTDVRYRDGVAAGSEGW